MILYKKLNRKESNLLKKNLQNLCKQWLGKEGLYSLENWNGFCKYCDIFVAMNCNTIVGILVISLASIYQCEQMIECAEQYNLNINKTIHIMMIAVDPFYRNKGIGKELFNMMFGKSDFQDILHYILAMRENNSNAKQFYLKHGFFDSKFKCDAMYENPIDNQIFMIKNV